MFKNIIRVLFVLVLFSFLMTAGCSMTQENNDSDDDINIPENNADTEETISEDIEDTSEKLTIVCLGDSVTQGIFELAEGTKDYFIGYVMDPESAYPALLKNALIDLGYDATVINSGVSGNYVKDGIKRIARDVFAYSPDIVTVCFGLNDVCALSADEYAFNLRDLFTLIRDNLPDAKIVFMTPNMLADRVNEEVYDSYLNTSMALGNVEITESGLLDDFMESARALCSELGIPVCDAYAYWRNLYDNGEDISELLCSHVTHPIREMHGVFCDMLIETFKENGFIDS